MVNKLAQISAFIGSATWLIYWVGRWYKEWYFNQFNIPYEALGLGYHYYLFGSWLTILVALSGVSVALNLVMTILLKNRFLYLSLLLIPVIISTLVLILNPETFSANKSFLFKILTSKDLLVLCLGLYSFFLLFIHKLSSSQEFNLLFERVSNFIHQNAIFMVITIFITGWIYLGVVGHFIGVYHGRSAISYGKMGIKYVKVEDKWWMLVVRTEDGRNFLYDKTTDTTIIVNDDSINIVSGHIPND